MDPFADLKPEDVEKRRALLTTLHKHFVNYVESRRGDKLKNKESLFSGEVWTGEEALELGLIDGFHNYNSWIDSNYGTKVNVKHFTANKPKLLSQMLGASLQINLLDEGLVQQQQNSFKV